MALLRLRIGSNLRQPQVFSSREKWVLSDQLSWIPRSFLRLPRRDTSVVHLRTEDRRHTHQSIFGYVPFPWIHLPPEVIHHKEYLIIYLPHLYSRSKKSIFRTVVPNFSNSTSFTSPREAQLPLRVAAPQFSLKGWELNKASKNASALSSSKTSSYRNFRMYMGFARSLYGNQESCVGCILLLHTISEESLLFLCLENLGIEHFRAHEK